MVKADESIGEIAKQAAKKIGLPFSSKTKVFDNKGLEVSKVSEGQRTMDYVVFCFILGFVKDCEFSFLRMARTSFRCW